VNTQAPCPISHAQHVAQQIHAHESEHGPVHVASPYPDLSIAAFADALHQTAIQSQREAIAARRIQ
jgi:hypothetical protein